MAWVITFDGQVYREADLTMNEIRQMEVASNTTWRFINPLRSANNACVILETLLEHRAGLTADEAKAKVGAVKVNDFLDMLSEEEEDADLPTQYEEGFPPEADGTSTTS